MTQKMTEKQFLEQYNIHDFDIPLTSVDMGIFSVVDEQLHVLLVKRAQHPSLGKWALPGGFIDLKKDKSLDDTARRKLEEKTGVDTPYLEQIETVGSTKRDPRGWSVTVLYMALIDHTQIQLRPNESSQGIAWVSIEEAKANYKLAFDHNQLLEMAHQRLISKVQYTSLPVHLMPESFTLSELQQVYESIIGQEIEKKSFRRRIQDAEILEETGEMKRSGRRPAKLYRLIDREAGAHFFTRNLEGPRNKE